MASVYDSAAYKRGPSSLYGADDYIERHHVKEDLVGKIKSVLAGAHYTSAPVDKEAFVPFGDDSTDTETSTEVGITEEGAPAISLDDTSGGLPPLVSTGLDSDGSDLSEEPEEVTTKDTGLELGAASVDSSDLSEEGEVVTTTESSLDLGTPGGEVDSGEGSATIPDLGSEPELAPEPIPEPEPEPVVEPTPEPEPTPEAAKKEAYKIDEAKLGINAQKILASDDHAEEKAKKLARVVVSDIFLYNSEHVDVGIREGTFYKLIKEDLRDGIKYMKRKIPKHLPSDKILKEAFDEYILKRKEMMDKD